VRMSELFDSLGAGNLLKDLHATLGSLKKINVSGAEPEVAGLVEQVSDLFHIVESFDHLATKERRQPSAHLSLRSANAVLHLQAVLDSTSAIIDECTPFVRPLQANLEILIHERNVSGNQWTENRLENQTWFEEIYQALRLLTELLRALFTAIDLLQYEDDNDEDPQILKSRSSTATQLHFQIGLVAQKIHLNDQLNTEEV
jgi:hypothetical protein